MEPYSFYSELLLTRTHRDPSSILLFHGCRLFHVPTSIPSMSLYTWSVVLSSILFILCALSVSVLGMLHVDHRRLLRGGRLIMMAGMETMETMCLMYLIPFYWCRSSHYHKPVLPNEGTTNLLWCRQLSKSPLFCGEISLWENNISVHPFNIKISVEALLVWLFVIFTGPFCTSIVLWLPFHTV